MVREPVKKYVSSFYFPLPQKRKGYISKRDSNKLEFTPGFPLVGGTISAVLQSGVPVDVK